MPGMEDTTGFRLNGWHVLSILVGVFGIVMAVNFYMVHVALTTMSGIDTRNAYQRGLEYGKDVTGAQEQDKLQWVVDITVRPGPGPDRAVTVSALDKDKHPVAGLKAKLSLVNPSDARKDQSVVLSEEGPGIFTGAFKAEGGRWFLQLMLDDPSGTMRFRSRNTVTLQ